MHGTPPADRPNFIICMCDELRAHEVGCYGHPTIRTPHVDGLAAAGTRFEHGITNAPVCLPARATVLSGQHARTSSDLGNISWPGAEGAPFHAVGFPQWPTQRRGHFPDRTLPELLRDAGYTTAAIGKWHTEAWPDAIGFDRYVIPAHHHANTAQWFIKDGGPVYSPDGFGLDHELDEADAWLRDRGDDGRPFFLYHNLSPPHMPLLDAPQAYLEMYRDEDVVVRDNVPDGFWPGDATVLTYLWDYRHYRDHLPYASTLPAGMTMRRLQALYMGLTTWVDDAVGRLLASLDTHGLADNTVVVFVADHGDNFGSHGWMGKSHLNEESIRVPFVVRGPGVQAGAVNATQVASLVDLAGTFLDMAGVGVPAYLHSQSLAPVLTGDRDTLDRPHAFIEAGHGIGVRTPTQTYGLPWAETGRPGVGDRSHWCFDNAADPYQLDNRADGDGLLKWADELDAELRAWHADTPWRAV